MTNPLIQAIDERISGLENLMAHKWEDKGLLEWRINELKEARKLAIAEETRIVKELESNEVWHKIGDSTNQQDGQHHIAVIHRAKELAYAHAIKIVKGE